MELDINSYWISFNTYAAPGALHPAKLLEEAERPADAVPERRTTATSSPSTGGEPEPSVRFALLVGLAVALAVACIVLGGVAHDAGGSVPIAV